MIKVVLGNPKKIISALQTTEKSIFGQPAVLMCTGKFFRVDHECTTVANKGPSVLGKDASGQSKKNYFSSTDHGEEDFWPDQLS